MKNIFKYLLLPITILWIVVSCANVGRLEGGPMDFTPPRLVSSTPNASALEVKKGKITLHFNEYIKLDRINEKVFVSPPQLQQPEIKASGKSVHITLLDSLKPNSTYTIDFSDAIKDNNEGNEIPNFSFSFSTGGEIDSMEVSGTVIDAKTLEAVKGIMVGIHTEDDDSLFLSKPFERAARTNSKGEFTIKGLSNKKFKIYALNDNDQNAAFTQKSEIIAFIDSFITPNFDIRTKMDTVWYDSITYDTIIERTYTHFLPDNIVLKAFKENSENRYLKKTERTDNKYLTIVFKGESDTLPTIKGLNFNSDDAFFIQKNATNDSLIYWIKDSAVYSKDSLIYTLDYYYTDTLNNLVIKTDTIYSVAKQKQISTEKEDKKKKKKNKDADDNAKEKVFLQMDLRASTNMNVYDDIVLSFMEPVKEYDKNKIRLLHKVDTIWKQIDYDMSEDSIDIKKLRIYHDWEPTHEYKIQIDSAAFTGLYGLHTNKLEQSFKIRSEDEYFTLTFNVEGADKNAYIELLDSRDMVVRKRKLENNSATFYYLEPGKYAARLINDVNGNGMWDTGDYKTKRQPEEVFYYTNMMEYKAMWDATQTWNVRGVEITKQKPLEIRKQKPEDKRKNNRGRGNR